MIKVIVLELTVCFETNTVKSRSYKQSRYRELKEKLLIACDVFTMIFLEVTTLGFISSASYKPLNDFLTEIGVNKDRTTA